MRRIEISTEVFARIWALRKDGEDNEDQVLRRVLLKDYPSFPKAMHSKRPPLGGLRDPRFGVVFPEGFQIERTYLGNTFRAVVQNGQWVIDGVEGSFSRLNELSRAIGTKTENAWLNWFYIDDDGKRRPVSDLRDPESIVSRPKANSEAAHIGRNRPRQDGKVRWCDDVREALRRLGGAGHLGQIYKQVRDIRGAAGRSTPPSLEEVVRKELEMRSSDSEVYDADRGEDWFRMPEGKGSGIWALRGR